MGAVDCLTAMAVIEVGPEFDTAVAFIKEPANVFKKSVPTARKLILYSRFKQATEGDVKTVRPGIFSVVERQKWDAWKACEGRDASEMMQEYIDEVRHRRGSSLRHKG